MRLVVNKVYFIYHGSWRYELKQMRGSDWNAELLDELQDQVGCAYLSNLYEQDWAEALYQAVLQTPEDAYPALQWKMAATYIMRRPCDAGNASQIREELSQYLLNRLQ